MQPLRADDDRGRSPILVGERYELGNWLGEGASSITFRAVDTKLGRTVAIKLLRSRYAADRQFVARFEREARLAASVSHPNIVDVYDYGTHEDTYFIAMQYIEGSDLRRRLDDHQRLSTTEAAHIVGHVLIGLGAIHAIGIIHRDIKPQNVLVGSDNVARVTDFGVAHASIETGLTSDGSTIGTAAYMAPEQARGGALSVRTDLYAVGVMLFECVTGRLPFQASNPMAVMLAHLQRPPPRPSDIAPEAGIPAALDTVILRALAKDPADRFTDAPEMARALAAAVPQAQSADSDVTRQLTAVPAAATTTALPALESPAPPARLHASAAIPPRRERPGLTQLWPVVFLVLALLAGGGALAGTIGDRWGNDDGDGSDRPAVVSDDTPTPTSTVTTRVATSAPTATSITIRGAVATASATPRPPTATPTLRPTATATPTARPAATSTPRPTATPPPTPTPMPTETAVPLPSATTVPTDTPVPVDTDDDTFSAPPTIVSSGAASVDSSENVQDASLSSQGAQGASIVFSPYDWSGACTGIDESMYGREAVAIRGAQSPCPSATLSFTLDEAPATDTTLTINGFNGENVPLLAALEINGSRSSSSQQFFEMWDGDLSSVSSTWGTAQLSLPPGYLQAGRNTISLVSTTPGSGSWGPPYLLLGEATLEL
ncbi:MAG TPA: serine/threonine-protein kinase [Thermomicrobiales bacterium]|nr:serine/threonine-protein kinase [Thermomicrobiales bacterium]